MSTAANAAEVSMHVTRSAGFNREKHEFGCGSFNCATATPEQVTQTVIVWRQSNPGLNNVLLQLGGHIGEWIVREKVCADSVSVADERLHSDELNNYLVAVQQYNITELIVHADTLSSKWTGSAPGGTATSERIAYFWLLYDLCMGR